MEETVGIVCFLAIEEKLQQYVGIQSEAHGLTVFMSEEFLWSSRAA